MGYHKALSSPTLPRWKKISSDVDTDASKAMNARSRELDENGDSERRTKYDVRMPRRWVSNKVNPAQSFWGRSQGLKQQDTKYGSCSTRNGWYA